MIFKYRYDIRFKLRVKLGKAFIWEKHFSDDDIQRTVTKSWIKIGCLPSANMPVKSHQSIIKKRRERVTHAYQNAAVNTCTTDDIDKMAPKSSSILSLLDILAEFKSLNLTNWRVYVERKFVHLTYYENLDLHGIASLSFLISELGNGEMSFSIAKNGLYCEELSNQISMEHWNLEKTLNLLMRFRSCSGYDAVLRKDGWLHVPLRLVEGSSARYVQSRHMLWLRYRMYAEFGILFAGISLSNLAFLFKCIIYQA